MEEPQGAPNAPLKDASPSSSSASSNSAPGGQEAQRRPASQEGREGGQQQQPRAGYPSAALAEGANQPATAPQRDAPAHAEETEPIARSADPSASVSDLNTRFPNPVEVIPESPPPRHPSAVDASLLRVAAGEESSNASERGKSRDEALSPPQNPAATSQAQTAIQVNQPADRAARLKNRRRLQRNCLCNMLHATLSASVFAVLVLAIIFTYGAYTAPSSVFFARASQLFLLLLAVLVSGFQKKIRKLLRLQDTPAWNHPQTIIATVLVVFLGILNIWLFGEVAHDQERTAWSASVVSLLLAIVTNVMQDELCALAEELD